MKQGILRESEFAAYGGLRHYDALLDWTERVESGEAREALMFSEWLKGAMPITLPFCGPCFAECGVPYIECELIPNSPDNSEVEVECNVCKIMTKKIYRI